MTEPAWTTTGRPANDAARTWLRGIHRMERRNALQMVRDGFADWLWWIRRT